MPDGAFTVSPSSLASLGSGVTAVRSSLDSTAALVGDGSCLGSSIASDALSDFVSGWRDGRRQISADLDAVASMLATAAQVYLESENSVCAAIPVVSP
jgi:hypothetical protein